MKKYTKPEVEITAFDFEDITMSSIDANSNKAAFGTDYKAASDNAIVVDASGVIW